MKPAHAVLCLAVFMVVGLGVAWPSLDYDWHWDDLHLVRSFSAGEIASAFTGTWDPDGIETKGFRPGTVLFNDLRARMFGESVRGHRVFLIVLFAGYLVLLGALVSRLGGPWWAGLIAGILTLCSKNSYYHFVWIADGIHLVPAVLFVVAAHLLISYLDSRRQALGAVSGVLLLVALAAREDALALYPVVLLMGAAYLWIFDRPREAYWSLARYAVFLFLTFLPFWAWRLRVVPAAPNFRLNRDVLIGPLTLMRWAVAPSGQSGLLPLAFLSAAVLLVAGTLRLPRQERLQSLMWLGLAVMTCLPGAVRVRPNLLFFPISFYAVFATLTMTALARTSRVALAVVMILFVVASGISVRASRLEQLSLHPLSADKLYHDWEVTYSKIRFPSTPPVRVPPMKARLARFGIVDDSFDFARWQQDLRQRGRVGFIDDGDAFLPEKNFLTP